MLGVSNRHKDLQIKVNRIVLHSLPPNRPKTYEVITRSGISLFRYKLVPRSMDERAGFLFVCF